MDFTHSAALASLHVPGAAGGLTLGVANDQRSVPIATTANRIPACKMRFRTAPVYRYSREGLEGSRRPAIEPPAVTDLQCEFGADNVVLGRVFEGETEFLAKAHYVAIVGENVGG